MESEPKTLQEAIQYFSDPDRCLKYIMARRWPNGVVCPTCGSTEVRFIATRRMWECKTQHPKKQFSIKIGTIFEDSPLPLDKWLCAMWLIVSCKNGISSYEVSRDLAISQKSAWHMMHRIRLALQSGSLNKLSGEVEVDETFIGGKARNMHKNKKWAKMRDFSGVVGKVAVMGLLERDGQVRAKVIRNTRRKSLQPEILKHVEPGTTIYSDALKSYEKIGDDYIHQVIDHAEKYVDGQIHTNGMENFWSLLKRGLKGTYISVEPFHLFRYLDEQVYRFNNRKHDNGQPLTDSDRFDLAVRQIVGKRLTWAEVTGKVMDRPTNVN
jgi:transposase-like protein